MMANEYKLSYTAQEIDEKLGKIINADYLQNDPNQPDHINNRPFFKSLESVNYILPYDIYQTSPGESINEAFVGYRFFSQEFDSRSALWINKIAICANGQYIFKLNGESFSITLNKNSDSSSYMFGNQSFISSDYPDTGEKFFGTIQFEEDYEYINNKNQYFYILSFNILLQSSLENSEIGILYKNDNVQLIKTEIDDYDDTFNNGYYNYLEAEEIQMLECWYFGASESMSSDEFEDLTEEQIEEVYAKIKSNFKFDDQVYENVGMRIYKHYYKPTEFDLYQYIGNMSLYDPAAPDTGESFLFLPMADGWGYPQILYTESRSHTIEWELVGVPHNINLVKLDSEFLPSDLLYQGKIKSYAENAYSIGEDSYAGNKAVAIGGNANDNSVSIGVSTQASNYSVNIGNASNSPLSLNYTKGGYNSIKFIVSKNNDYNIYSQLKNLSQIPIKFSTKSVNNSTYDENQIFVLNQQSINENDDEITFEFKSESSPYIPYYDLNESGECEVIISGFAGNHSILLGDGIAIDTSFVSNAKAQGKNNIVISKNSSNYDYNYEIPEVIGDNNISLGKSKVYGDNNVILNGQFGQKGNDNIVINSGSGSTNNSIYLNTGNKIELLGELFGGGGYDHNGPQYPTVSKTYESKLYIGRVYYLVHGSYNVDTNNIKPSDLYQLIGYEPSLKYPDDHFRLFFKPLNSNEIYTHNNTYETYGLVNISVGNNCFVIGQGNYSVTNDQTILGQYAQIDESIRFALGNGLDANSRNNLFEINKDGTAKVNKIITNSIEIRNTNNEASYVSQDCMVLRDIETNWEYAYQMKGGTLITTLLPTHIEVTKLPTKLEYVQGDSLDPTGMEIIAFYPDDTTKIITEFEILLPNDKNYLYDIGSNKVSIRAKLPLSYLTEIEVNVTEFDYETALIDFNYTVNSDGTITLNSWKRTLNGQSSSELVVPNNGLIKI